MAKKKAKIKKPKNGADSKKKKEKKYVSCEIKIDWDKLLELYNSGQEIEGVTINEDVDDDIIQAYEDEDAEKESGD
jgi:hypothetical protein